MRPVTSRSSATPSMRQGAKLSCRNAFSSDSRRAMGGSLSGRGGGARAARPAAAGERPVEVCEAVVDNARDQRRLVAEVMVDGGRRDAGARAELADGEVALGEQVLGGRQDGAPRALRLGVAGAGEGGGAGSHGPSVAPL